MFIGIHVTLCPNVISNEVSLSYLNPLFHKIMTIAKPLDSTYIIYNMFYHPTMEKAIIWRKKPYTVTFSRNSSESVCGLDVSDLRQQCRLSICTETSRLVDLIFAIDLLIFFSLFS